MIALALAWKIALFNIMHITVNCRSKEVRRIAVLPHELRGLRETQIYKIMENENLPVAIGACANTDGGYIEPLRNILRDFTRHTLKHNRGDAGLLQRKSILQKRVSRCYRFALH